ncbi:MAG: fumarylacetoacetate hydrolase family protein [Alphaproteobacteria bacterium]
MKLATLRDGTRDGQLIVVSKDLTNAVSATDITQTMQQAIDNWSRCAPQLQARYSELNNGTAEGSFSLNPQNLMAPLPRAYQWLDGSAYVNHVELVRKARGAELPESFWTDPLMYQGGSDNMIGCRDSIVMPSEEFGIDFESEIAVITDDVPMGVTETEAYDHIKLITILNDVSLRNLIPSELGKNFGFVQSKPATAFAAVMVTPDELGSAWQDGRVHLPMYTEYNGQQFGSPDAGPDMTFNFPQLIAHAAKTRFLGAGTIIGSGTVSNQDTSKGSSCIAEKRMLEVINSGSATTPFMSFGDSVKIYMNDASGQSIFGSIEQKVEAYEAGNQEQQRQYAL